MTGTLSLPPPRRRLSLSVSGRVIVFTVIIWIGLLAGMFEVQENIFRPTFAKIETSLLVKDLERVEAAVLREGEQLSRTADDYASWEDMRAFVAASGKSEELPQALKPAILDTLDLDALFVFNAVGRVQHSLSRVPESVTLESPEFTPAGFANQFPVIASVRTQGSGVHRSQGLVRFKGGRLAFAVSAPVVDPATGGKALGTVVLLRELNQKAIDRLAEQVRLPLVIRPENAKGLSPAAKDAVPSFHGGQIMASAWLRDPFGQPIAEYSVTRQATILQQGEGTLVSGGVGSIIVLSVVLIILILLLQFAVVRPLGRLTRSVENMRRTGDLSIRMNLNRADEIGLLGYNFDRLVALLDERTRTLEELATTDGLTKLANRRTIIEYVTRELESAKNAATELAVLIIDVDHFKKINDTVGHAVGDRVLRQVAATIRSNLGPKARAGRLGGEEFIIVVVSMARSDVLLLAERIRTSIAESPIQGLDWAVTASVGVGYFSGQTVHGLLATADLNLYRAKQSGRNRVVAEEVAASLLPAASIPPPAGNMAILV
jgi:diguanylate cyclase (GGDEF)-like protein